MQNASNTVKANGCIRSKYGVFLEGINRDAGGRGGDLEFGPINTFAHLRYRTSQIYIYFFYTGPLVGVILWAPLLSCRPSKLYE
jgi:hypothetical protein